MSSHATYSYARTHLKAFCDEVASTREPIIIHRRGAEDVALMPADELRSLMETAYLLRSPKNAQRLLTAVLAARSEDLPSETVEAFRSEFGLDPL